MNGSFFLVRKTMEENVINIPEHDTWRISEKIKRLKVY